MYIHSVYFSFNSVCASILMNYERTTRNISEYSFKKVCVFSNSEQVHNHKS